MPLEATYVTALIHIPLGHYANTFQVFVSTIGKKQTSLKFQTEFNCGAFINYRLEYSLLTHSYTVQ